MSLSQQERDSLLKDYDQIFPIWGRKALERGFQTPLPLGFNVGFYSMRQDIEISNLGIGFNKPAQPVSFITFEGASARLDLVNARMDLWLFPFLNVYGIVGTGSGTTTVRIAEPVAFETRADFDGASRRIRTHRGVRDAEFLRRGGLQPSVGLLEFARQPRARQHPQYEAGPEGALRRPQERSRHGVAGHDVSGARERDQRQHQAVGGAARRIRQPLQRLPECPVVHGPRPSPESPGGRIRAAARLGTRYHGRELHA